MTYLNVKNLFFNYESAEENAVDDFSIDLEKGEILVILGASGSGKTSILRLLAGFELPNSGSISIADSILVDEKTFLHPEKRRVSMVFQDYVLFPHLTVEKNIGFGLNKLSRKVRKEKVEEILRIIELKGYNKRYPHQLSAGQKQRVAIGRSLAVAPDLLLLDEPFSNLDSGLKSEIRIEIKKIINSTKTTAVVVSHDINDAKAIADKIVILEQGKIIKLEKNKPAEFD